MPPDMEISMRHTKLKPEEAALLAGEVKKPTWQSKNEGIHERISFEDTIWGFDLAGGSFYKTPLRVTSVKPDSRAEKAGIRPGDKLKRINDIDTSTLTIQEAHDIIVESGIYLRLAVTAPEDEEDSYNCYEDPLMKPYDDSEERRRLEEELAAKRRVHAKVSSYWSLQWPWVSKKRFLYRESNCFMVNSKYEEARRDKYPIRPTLRYTDDAALYQKDGDILKNINENKNETPSENKLEENNNASHERLTNGDGNTTSTDEEQLNHVNDVEPLINQNVSIPSIPEENNEQDTNYNTRLDNPIEEFQETKDDELVETDSVVNNINGQNSDELDTLNSNTENEMDSPIPEAIENSRLTEEDNERSEDDVLNEVLAKNNENITHSEEDNILDSILSDDGQNLENSENSER